MKRLFAITILSALLALPAAAQTSTASLGGRIWNSNGPVEGATVVAIHTQTNTQYYASTDSRGWYQLLDMLPGGPYTVRIHYFEYKPLTVRDLYLFVGQNSLVDADIEAGETYVRRDEAATSMRIGEALVGGEVNISPLDYNLIGQRTYTSVPFDVRQEASLYGASMLQTTPVGSNRFHGSAYGYYCPSLSEFSEATASPSSDILSPSQENARSTDYHSPCSTVGLTLAAPLAGDDYQFFAGLQYDGAFGLSGSGRLDARFDESNHLDITGGRIPGTEAWGSAGLTSSLLDGHASNRLQAGWYGNADSGQFLASDDFTYSSGRQRMLFGLQFAHQNFSALDSAANRFDFYLQDAVRFGRRLTVAAGVRFCFPFTFSPRVSAYYDVLGNGSVVLRGGVAVYGRHGQSSTWKNLAAVDVRLPADFIFSVEGVYAQEWERLFIISSRNRLQTYHELTARLERYFADNLWAVASYSLNDGIFSNKVVGGFSYKADYLGRFATSFSFLYRGYSFVDNESPASFSWMNNLEVRVSQDIGFTAVGRDHCLQLTAYAVRSAQGTQFLAGLHYLL